MLNLISTQSFILFPLFLIVAVWVTSIWIFIDIKTNNFQIKLPYANENFGPFAWFFTCHFFPILFIPVYLFERNKVMRFNVPKPFQGKFEKLIPTKNRAL